MAGSLRASSFCPYGLSVLGDPQTSPAWLASLPTPPLLCCSHGHPGLSRKVCPSSPSPGRALPQTPTLPAAPNWPPKVAGILSFLMKPLTVPLGPVGTRPGPFVARQGLTTLLPLPAPAWGQHCHLQEARFLTHCRVCPACPTSASPAPVALSSHFLGAAETRLS